MLNFTCTGLHRYSACQSHKTNDKIKRTTSVISGRKNKNMSIIDDAGK